MGTQHSSREVIPVSGSAGGQEVTILLGQQKRRPLLVVTELATQPGHVHLEGLGTTGGVLTPDLLEDVLTGGDLGAQPGERPR